jgi:hypothetical protein
MADWICVGVSDPTPVASSPGNPSTPRRARHTADGGGWAEYADYFITAVLSYASNMNVVSLI